ncbi:MAG: nitrite/sulfite reductase [Phycisphaerae bacterium]
MKNTYQLPEGIAGNLENFRQVINQYKTGSLPYPQFRAIHVPFGIYDERQPGNFMLRIRLPAGLILPHQMRTVAAVSEKYGDGIPHITTRQDIQIHKVTLDNMGPALSELLQAGLSTKGGGGNTVRNITTCPHAGVCRNEVFDTTPYATALTEFLLTSPDSFDLPRKFKIAFSGCPHDCAGATIHDVGFIAKKQNGKGGFRVYAGGGLGAGKRIADILEDFIPAEDFHRSAQAVKKIFHKHGERNNKNRARLRFLVERIGLDQFRKLYQIELAELPKLPLQIHQTACHKSSSPCLNESFLPDFELWKKRNTNPQKQPDFYIVQIPLPLGDIPGTTLLALADVVENHGEGSVRATAHQNLLLRWVRENELPTLHKKLSKLALTDVRPCPYRDIVTCTGASTCRLGICLSRGLAQAITNKLSDLNLALHETNINIHISGCPNSCGRHPIAAIGIMGAARKIGRHLVPHYILHFGGTIREGKTQFASGNHALPAKNIPDFLAEFLEAFTHSSHYPAFHAFLDADGRQVIDHLAEKFKTVPDFTQNKDFYCDWGSTTQFSLAERR